jgi:RNA polymerase sigma-70 factor (ECF subfamily)
LPEAYREAIQLTKVSGLSMQEAAAVLGTTPTAVKLRVHRGYVALRKALDNVGGQPE